MEKKAFDYIVVGSGLAGLSFALKAAHYGEVLLLTKGSIDAGSTGRAQGGIASVISPKDSLKKHVDDTLMAGAGLCRKDRVELLVSEGPEAIKSLIEWGVQFSKDKESVGSLESYDLAKEGGHSESRILHSGDITGQEIQRALVESIKKNKRILIKEEVMAIDLLTSKHKKEENEEPNRCYGLYGLDVKKGKVLTFVGAETILCTGGLGQLYTHNTNDKVSTGDGIAMAYRAGVPVEDMEFMQFHPTSFYDFEQPPFLISEALRGHGGVLINEAGAAIMKGIHPMADLAPRDIVARAIDEEMKKSGSTHVYLDMRAFSTEELKERFPNIYKHCLKRGVEISKMPIPVVPAAHFLCGGIQVDENSATSLKGLYACGETASTGVHGANRLASNSLLEALVFSNRALKAIVKESHQLPDSKGFWDWDDSRVQPTTDLGTYRSALEALRSILWNYVGIVRNNRRLKRASEFVKVIQSQVIDDYGLYTMDPKLIELRNLALNAELIIKSALCRKESRGLHYNSDFPELSEPCHTVIT